MLHFDTRNGGRGGLEKHYNAMRLSFCGALSGPIGALGGTWLEVVAIVLPLVELVLHLLFKGFNKGGDIIPLILNHKGSGGGIH